MSRNSSEELDRLATAVSRCVRLIKQPAYWQTVTSIAGTTIDRPGAIILQILDRQPCRLIELAEQIGIEAPSISRKVHELTQSGLIESQTDPNDHRAHSLRLSTAGHALALSLRKAQRTLLRNILKSWPEDNKLQLVIMLENLADSVSQYFTPSTKTEPFTLTGAGK